MVTALPRDRFRPLACRGGRYFDPVTLEPFGQSNIVIVGPQIIAISPRARADYLGPLAHLVECEHAAPLLREPQRRHGICEERLDAAIPGQQTVLPVIAVDGL